MNFEKYLPELENLKNARQERADKIKSHNLPVIIYGAAETARRVTDELARLGTKVDGYAVDIEYFKPNKIYLGKPVYNFAELVKQPDKFVFVLGMEDEAYGGVSALNFLQNKNLVKYAFIRDFFLIDCEYIAAHKNKFAETFSILDDELSRQTMIAYLKAKLTGDPSYNFNVYDSNQYFNALTEPAGGGGYVDCGAYRGDTVEKFIEWSGGKYGKIFAIEADKKNFVELENFVREKNFSNVSTFNCGVWHEKTKLTFDATNNTGAMISDVGNVTIDAEKIDDLIGGESVNFIKMDIEGSELNALRGAAETIKKDLPTLAICVYHKAEDLITIPQFIKNLHGGYKFYLRKHTRVAETELVLYGVN